MGLFSRKKKSEPAEGAVEPDAPRSSGSDRQGRDGAAEPAAVADRTTPDAPQDAPAPAAPEDAAPQVSISVSAFRGIGAAGPEAPTQPEDPFDDDTPLTRAPAPKPSPPLRPELPRAPAAPPSALETVPGLRDNALLRDALAALPEKPTGGQVMGVLRQLLQGHVFLRVKGDAREQIAAGKPVAFGIARIGEKSFMLAYSSGQALREAVQSDEDTATSAVAQPVGSLLRQLLAGEFGGIVIDNSSAPRRVVLPREIVEQAVNQADPELRLKALLTAPREADTPRRVAELLAERPPLWVAVAALSGDESRMGIAEARLADGTRLVQVHSHPLEVVALGRGEKALPIEVGKLGGMLRDHPELGGLLIDPAGPLITLTREELAPVMALAE